VFQDPFDSLNPRMTVRDVIEEPLRLRGRSSRGQRWYRVRELLERVGLRHEIALAYPHQLGGGEAQRVAIARALASEPLFVVLDEITSSLDPIARAEVIEVLLDVQRQLGLTYLFISHDLNIVQHVADRVAVMYLGEIVEIADASELFELQLHPYSKALLSSVLHPDPKRPRVRFDLAGEIPSPIDLPRGCYLHSRCPVAMEVCKSRHPMLDRLGERRYVACH
jgi:oligopeptide/dipeptide ABC transporter ATP-binding protein